MNIFEALSRGKGCINEENTSSLLAYFLDPKENHGLGTSFLESFLDCLNIDENEIKLTDIDNFEIKLEFNVKTCKNCYIDMVFEINNHIIAVENKIFESSKKNGQLQNEYDGLKKSNYYSETLKPIIMCYLVPKDCNECKNVNTSENDICMPITWDKLIKVLRKLLQKENHAIINPINEYTKQTIKAFINYMEDVLNPKFVVIDDNYRLYKYSSGQIIVKQKEGKSNWVSAEPSSKAIIKQKLKSLNKEYNDETMKLGTTRSLGAKLFKELS